MSDKQIKVAFIGLDTSHSVQFAQYIQDPNIPAENRCTDLLVTRCMRFETPFQGKEGLDARQKQLEALGVLVTEDFDEAVADCDAIFLEINDPKLHLEYFKKCSKLGKPIFLDKPFADTLENAKAIARIAEENNIKFFTASKLRNFQSIEDLAARKLDVKTAMAWGSLGKCPEGYSLIIWYGVHTFELLERMMELREGLCHALLIIDHDRTISTKLSHLQRHHHTVVMVRSILTTLEQGKGFLCRTLGIISIWLHSQQSLSQAMALDYHLITLDLHLHAHLGQHLTDSLGPVTFLIGKTAYASYTARSLAECRKN